MSGGGDQLIALLYQYGTPTFVVGVLGSIARAYSKRRALIKSTPEQKIDTSLARMQQTAIVQDQLVESLQEALAASTARERELQARLSEIEHQLELARQQVRDVTEQLNQTSRSLDALRAQFPRPRPTPSETS